MTSNTTSCFNNSDFIHITEILEHLKKHKKALESILEDLDINDQYYDELLKMMNKMISTGNFTIEC
jgi:hypothetical protein